MQAVCLETSKQKQCSAGLQFQPITLNDKVKIESYTKPWHMDCSDLSFANLFIWGTEGKMQYAEKNDVLYIRLEFQQVPVFLWAPIPKKGITVDYRKAIEEGISYLQYLGVEPTFRSVWTPFRDMMIEAYPELFVLPTDIAWDYVYERESLATLKGKKLHKKRNHINKFLSQYPDYEYKKIDDAIIPDCIALYDRWLNEKQQNNELLDEKKSVLLALNHMKELGLTGGAIYIDGVLKAFTVGERIREDMQLVHIEKADIDIDGLYPIMNQQYILHECMDVTYMNREEDMGHSGMRKAKRSYYPCYMVEKYLLSLKDMSACTDLWGTSEDE